jgi:predicted transposase YbfD/YdcC
VGVYLIAIDGKTSRGTHDEEAKLMHVVSAFVTEDKLTLANRTVDCKTNEINAIPKLLEVIDIKNAIVTIDAMGRQIDKGGNYILALKGNQKTLENDVQNIFKNISQISNKYVSIHETYAKLHGRFELCTCTVITDDKWLNWLKDSRKDWASIKGKESIEDRFYISGLDNPSAE